MCFVSCNAVLQAPIESSFIKALADHMNAEIVNGTINNIKEAAAWLSYTFLFVRMGHNPVAYGMSMEDRCPRKLFAQYIHAVFICFASPLSPTHIQTVVHTSKPTRLLVVQNSFYK